MRLLEKNFDASDRVYDCAIRAYIDGATLKQAGKLVGISSSAMYRLLKKHDIATRGVSEAQRDPQIDHGFFAHLNPRSAYWAGLWAADGCLHLQNGRTFILRLSLKDGEHVEKFAYQIGVPYRVRKDVLITTAFGLTRASILQFASKEMWQDLKTKFGLSPNKTKVIIAPPISDSRRHFIRGYLDGDGHLLSASDGIGFSGTRAMLSWIKTVLQKSCSAGNPKIYKDKGIYGIRFAGKRQTTSIVGWLYHDVLADLRMDRKFRIASRFLEDHTA